MIHSMKSSRYIVTQKYYFLDIDQIGVHTIKLKV